MLDLLKQKIQIFEEEKIIKKIQKGDLNEFSKLYQKYIDLIFRYIFFRVNQNKMTAEDLTEMTFQKAYTNINSFKLAKGTFKSWIFKIAHNNVVDFYRSAGRETPLSHLAQSLDNVEDEVNKKISIEEIKKALTYLSDEQRNVITMRFINDMENSEIAKILDKKEDAIRAIQYRALKNLREKFKEYEI